ncbi:MAG: TetR/AcrR family transcriptional regulator [Chloroflexi bacterium]|nr:TetR/AcrR family transcriptional regulator [Chloroflexota bacterium]
MPDVKDYVTTSLREERAAVTRGRITNAARQLFRSQGYGATTLTAVAWEAGVAVQTIYAVYRSKPGILRALRESVLNQPEAEALFEEALRARHGDRALELFARSIRRRWEYGADIVVIHRDAATADRAVRAEVDRILTIRRAGLGRLARSLDGELCADVDVERATAILDALTLPEVYLELVDVQGWTADGFEVWLRRLLRQQLIE